MWDAVKPKVIPVLDVRATVASVGSGNLDAGFVYKTDAAVSKKVRVVFEVPVEKGPKIVYPVAILKDSKKKVAARDFIDFIAGLSAKDIFNRYGFIVLH